MQNEVVNPKIVHGRNLNEIIAFFAKRGKPINPTHHRIQDKMCEDVYKENDGRSEIFLFF